MYPRVASLSYTNSMDGRNPMPVMTKFFREGVNLVEERVIQNGEGIIISSNGIVDSKIKTNPFTSKSSFVKYLH